MLNEISAQKKEVEPVTGSLIETLDQIELEKGMPEAPLKISDEEAMENAVKGDLKRAYNSEESYSLVRKIVISILCYMLTHNKRAFAISYKRVRSIYLSDPNWQNHSRFEDGTFLNVCAILADLGIKRIVKHNKYRPGIVFAFEYSQISKNIDCDSERELSELFKIFHTTEDDFVDDEARNRFGVLLPK